MNEKYYIIINNTKEGPFSFNELKTKDVSKDALLWKKGLDTWVRALELDELRELLEELPPPLPTTSKTKTKRKNLNLTIANETKSIFHHIKIAFIAGIISFPIFYFIVYDVEKYDNFDSTSISTNNSGYGNTYNINISDFTSCIQNVYPGQIKSVIKIRRKCLTKKSVRGSFYTFLLIGLILVIARYFSKSAKWIKDKQTID